MKLYEVLEKHSKFCFCCIKFIGREELHFMTGYNALDLYGDYNVKSITYKDDVKIYEIEKAVNK